jgi:hypothetical protein
MADTLVERVTGRDPAVPTPIPVNLVLSAVLPRAAGNICAGKADFGVECQVRGKV